MREYLIFRLYGSMAAWGDIAVGDTRLSHTHPTKSAVIGLIAGALGITRDDEEAHNRMSKGYGFAVRMDDAGVHLTDYHTIQVPPSRKGKRYNTRRDELSLKRHEFGTILSRRDYRMDPMYHVAIWAKDAPPYTLAEISDRLDSPEYIPYLGRKSCPLALPMEPQVVEAESIVNAFGKANFADLNLFDIRPGKTASLFWEDGAEAGVEAQQTFTRRDLPLSRGRWQFGVREEHHASLWKEG